MVAEGSQVENELIVNIWMPGRVLAVIKELLISLICRLRRLLLATLVKECRVHKALEAYRVVYVGLE